VNTHRRGKQNVVNSFRESDGKGGGKMVRGGGGSGETREGDVENSWEQESKRENCLSHIWSGGGREGGAMEVGRGGERDGGKRNAIWEGWGKAVRAFGEDQVN